MARTPLFRFVLRALQDARRANLREAGRPEPRPREVHGPSRRGVLAGAGAAIAAAGLPREVRAQAGAARQVAIIGAGIAGLSAAHHLRAAGHEVRIFEARGRVGGRMHSVVGPLGGGIIADLGAELVNTDHQDMRALCEAYGVPLFDRAAAMEALDMPKMALHFGGRAIGEAELAAAFREIAGQIAADAERTEADQVALAEIDRLTVTAYLDRHAGLIGAPFARAALEAAIRTEYGLEPDEASAVTLIYNLPTVKGDHIELISSDEVFAIEGGSQHLPLVMAEKFNQYVQLNTPVSRIALAEGGVSITAGGGQPRRFDAAVVTAPLPPLRNIEIQGNIPELFRRFIKEFGPGNNEKLIAAFKGRPWRDAKAFSGEAWSDTSVPLVWDTSMRQADLPEAALTFFLGGAPATEMRALSAGFVAKLVVERLEPIVPGLAAAATGRYVRTAWHRDPNAGGAYSAYRPGQMSTFAKCLWTEGEGETAAAGPVFGRLAFAGEHVSAEFGGYMNGGASTGRLAAEAISKVLAG